MNDKLREILFYILSWLFAVMFLTTFFIHTSFLTIYPSNNSDWLFLLLGLFFVFAPFFSKIKIAKLIEVERDLRKTKEDFSEFRTSTAQMIQFLSNSVNAVASLHNTININLPGNRELLQAKQDVEDVVRATSRAPADRIREELLSERADLNDALTRAKRRLEGLLRDILGKKATLPLTARKIKYMGLYQLFEEFIDKYPEYKNLQTPFADINNILNAASHAQQIPASQAETTLDVAAELIAAFEAINGEAITN
jgi:hypothetical protein